MRTLSSLYFVHYLIMMGAEVNLGDKHTLFTKEWALLSFIAMATTLVVHILASAFFFLAGR